MRKRCKVYWVLALIIALGLSSTAILIVFSEDQNKALYITACVGLALFLIITTVIVIGVSYFCIPMYRKKRAFIKSLRRAKQQRDKLINDYQNRIQQKIAIGDTSQCSICHGYYSYFNRQTIIECNHKFHKICIREWFKINNTCPICRRVY